MHLPRGVSEVTFFYLTEAIDDDNDDDHVDDDVNDDDYVDNDDDVEDDDDMTYELQRRNACKEVVASTLVNVNVLIPPKPNPMPTRHRTPTSTYQNRNIDRVSNRDLQKWKACEERRCRNVNKQERY